MMLVANGKPVRFKQGYNDAGTFAVENGDGSYSVVEEAVITKGDDVLWSDEHIAKALQLRGYGWLTYQRIMGTGEPEFRCPELKAFYNRDRRGSYAFSYHNETREFYPAGCIPSTNQQSPWIKEWYKGTFDGHDLPTSEFEAMLSFLVDLSNWTALYGTAGMNYAVLGGKSNVTNAVMLSLIGEGKTVTAISFKRGCAKGESRPRFIVSDAVKTKKATGIIANITNAGVVIQTTDGKKSTVSVNSLEQISIAKQELPEIDATLEENFSEALAHPELLYRAKMKIMEHVTIPMFPCEDQQPIELENPMTCTCPICGWQMAGHQHSQYSVGLPTFECCVCRQTGVVVDMSDDEIILKLNRLPSKNQFAIRESRCCANCANFGFESGRQGKRSTGYCKTSNQCLQAFNTCDYWAPRPPTEYDGNLRQHCTNLGYGVSDRRNTSRNDCRDTVYRKEDHESQKKRAEKARTAYTVHYSAYLDKLKKMGKKLPLTDEKVDEAVKQAFLKVLEGGV